MSRRSPGREASGLSVWTITGILLVAVSLVAVGAMVTLDSLNGTGGGVSRLPEPTPTAGPPRSTPAIVTVGPKAQAQDPGPTPAVGGTGAPSLQLPPAPSGTLFAPSVPGGAAAPSSAQPGSPAPAAAGAEPSPQTAGEPAPAPSPDAPPAGATAAEPQPIPTAPASPVAGQPTADRVAAEALARMTVEEKVGQLLLLAWIGGTAEEARPALRDLRAGGIVHVQNTTTMAGATTINQGLKQIARDVGVAPPLIAIDHEGGDVQRIRDVRNLGSNWEFAQSGAKEPEACERGSRHAQILREMGFSMNLAPDLDVNNNPANPVIGKRSYSDNPEVVARLGAAYIKGLQNGAVAAVGKHFPGHGNTSVDSHLGLPSLPQTIEQLDQIELIPFRKAVEVGIAGIMSAHIVFPSVDPSGDPATLSRPVMHGLLRERLGFKGLAISDDMGAMRAITDNYAPGVAAVRAVQAGVDMLILSAEFSRQRQSRDALLAAVQDGSISEERLNKAVTNVLLVKARYGLIGEGVVQTGGVCP